MSAVLKNPGALPAPAPIQQLHHYAYRAKDAEETRHFYEDIFGLPLYHIIQSDVVPSTGDQNPGVMNDFSVPRSESFIR